ncbi:MAG: hypothetical protein CVU68_11855 [Deltaproteobacteria bacterium HGW-Deltaproteobacteria-3]|nr:MAG: hypothetical protein CVU68_11855 [Deltaproteobacteria bacterium HGW-Deltaproteobacteria-3]
MQFLDEGKIGDDEFLQHMALYTGLGAVTEHSFRFRLFRDGPLWRSHHFNCAFFEQRVVRVLH